MKIAILGTGVIGTLYGWALSKKNEVVHFVRPAKRNELNRVKLHMDIIDERAPEDMQNIASEYTIHVKEQVDDSFDLVIIPIAEYQLEQALIDMTKQAPCTNYLLMGSNWNGVSLIEKYLNRNQYILGYAGGGGAFRAKAGIKELWGNIGADITIGAIDIKQEIFLQKIDQLFRQIDIVPEISTNVLDWLWVHNIDSAAMGVGLKKHGNIKEFLADKALIKVCFDAMKEGFCICEKRGVSLEKFQEVQMYNMPFEQLYPMFKNNFETNPVMQRYTAHAIEAIPEMERNFEQIYQSGKQFEISMPNMDKLYQILRKK